MIIDEIVNRIKRINRKQVLLLLGTIVVCIAAFSAGYWANERGQSPGEKLITTTYQLIVDDSLFNEQTDYELAYASIRGMLAVINDPYAELIEPEAAKNFMNTFAGQTGVVGLYAENKAGQVVISIIFPDSPAAEAGLKVGDVILAIDGTPLDKDSDSSETGLKIRGEPGTIVQLKVQRAGQITDYSLVRQVREFVSYRMLPDGVGYIALTAYNRTATGQMKTALENLMEQQPDGLIWDLRNNEGGDMQAAQDILSYFIGDGLLFYAELADDRTVQFFAKGKPIAAELPLVILMDKTTYSAAETCAAAVMETGRGQTIGGHSYGKGLIQGTIALSEDTLMQMTVARWYSPSGEWYQERGVPPMIEASDDPATEADELLQKAVEIITR